MHVDPVLNPNKPNEQPPAASLPGGGMRAAVLLRLALRHHGPLAQRAQGAGALGACALEVGGGH